MFHEDTLFGTDSANMQTKLAAERRSYHRIDTLSAPKARLRATPQRAKNARPDAILAFVLSGEGGTFLKQFVERGIDKAGIKLIGSGDVTDDDLLPAVSDAALGMVTAHFYSAAHPSEMNKAYVAAFKKANPSLRPNFMSVGGYDGMHLIYEALKKTGGRTDGDSLIAAVKGRACESPRGPISADPDTRD